MAVLVTTSRNLSWTKGLNLSFRCRILDMYQAPARSGSRRRADQRREQDCGAAAADSLAKHAPTPGTVKVGVGPYRRVRPRRFSRVDVCCGRVCSR